MKTYLLIQEDDKLEDPLYLESGPTTAVPPQVGDIIQVREPGEKHAHGATHKWDTRGFYRVIGRRYEVYDGRDIQQDIEMTCELLVERMMEKNS